MLEVVRKRCCRDASEVDSEERKVGKWQTQEFMVEATRSELTEMSQGLENLTKDPAQYSVISTNPAMLLLSMVQTQRISTRRIPTSYTSRD